MTDLTYVWADLTAWHTDPHLGEGRHQHTWRVTAYFNSAPFRDGRSLKASLCLILAPWDGADLPPELWASEDLAAAVLAAAVLQLHGNADCIGVRVEREEGFGASVGICA